MATDVFIKEGLTQRQMAEVAQRYRRQFDLAYTELINIIEILEFKIPEVFPGFSLVVRSRTDLTDEAVTDISRNRIFVREDIYDNACEGDEVCRFTLAHELGHFLLHRHKSSTLHKSRDGYQPTILNMNGTQSGESQADIFARHFLIHPHLAYKHRQDIATLAKITGTSPTQAKAAATISKRQEMCVARNDFPKSSQDDRGNDATSPPLL